MHQAEVLSYFDLECVSPNLVTFTVKYFEKITKNTFIANIMLQVDPVRNRKRLFTIHLLNYKTSIQLCIQSQCGVE